MILYHGTFSEFKLPFKPLTHFGTEQAAKDRYTELLKYAKRASNILKRNKNNTNFSITSKETLERHVNRVSSKYIIYKVEVSISNPIRILDTAVQHTPTQLAFALRNKILSQEEMLSVTTANSQEDKTKKLVKLVLSKGYDGLIYKNKYEDKGNDSFVILNGRQVRLISKSILQV